MEHNRRNLQAQGNLIGSGRQISFYSLLLTCLVLSLAVGASSNENRENFIRHLNKIGENLDKALNTAMELKQPNYTSINISVAYKSNTKYNPRGLGELYNITKAFMKLILPEAMPKGVFSVENNRVRVNLNDRWFDLLRQYSYVILICLVVVFLGAVLPFCGVFFCCCRICCGKCGARSRPYDKKHDLCRRFYLATMLIVCGTLLVFGVVCAFVTNQRLEDGIQTFTTDLKTSVDDANKYLNNTNGQVNILLKNNFDEFDEAIGQSLDECSEIVFKELEQISNATSMDDISEIAKQFPNIRKEYELLKNSTNDLRLYASQLNEAVRRIKKDLFDILKDCKFEQCITLNRDIANLQTNVDFDKLPDINKQIKDLDEILKNTNMDEITQGEQKLKQIQKEIKEAVRENTDKIKEKLKEAGKTLSKNADEITSNINRFRKYLGDLKESKKSVLDNYQGDIEHFDVYRQNVGLAICCVLLLVTLFVALGLIYGICGTRPGGYADDCCNKGSGSQCLLCGVIFMFFFSSLIAAATIIYFLVGLTAQELACDSLRKPKSSELFRLADSFDLSSYGLDAKISDVIDRCHRNRSIYEVLNLRKRFDIDQVYKYIDDFDIERALNELDKTTANIDFENFVLLTPEQSRALERIAKSGFADVAFQRFLDELSANFTSVDLNVITSELQAAIDKAKEIPDGNQLERRLDSVLVQLNFYERKVVMPMQETAEKVKSTATNLEKKLKLGHASFKEGMEDLIVKVKHAQDTLRVQGPKMIKEAAADFAEAILNQCKKYMQRVVQTTKEEVGVCAPLSNVYNATLVSACDKIALQMNGFWFTLLCSMLVFIPTIVISVKLAILYQKQVPYSDYYVETSRDKDKRKKKGKRREDRAQLTQRAGNAELVPRDVAGGSSHQDARNWEEFPAGGPPQYQRAPTEYERPPPYYYPGSSTTEQP